MNFLLLFPPPPFPSGRLTCVRPLFPPIQQLLRRAASVALPTWLEAVAYLSTLSIGLSLYFHDDKFYLLLPPYTFRKGKKKKIFYSGAALIL